MLDEWGSTCSDRTACDVGSSMGRRDSCFPASQKLPAGTNSPISSPQVVLAEDITHIMYVPRIVVLGLCGCGDRLMLIFLVYMFSTDLYIPISLHPKAGWISGARFCSQIRQAKDWSVARVPARVFVLESQHMVSGLVGWWVSRRPATQLRFSAVGMSGMGVYKGGTGTRRASPISQSFHSILPMIQPFMLDPISLSAVESNTFNGPRP